MLVLGSIASFANDEVFYNDSIDINLETEAIDHFEQNQYKKCWVKSYDSCPGALQWKCKRWKVYGKSYNNRVTTIAGPFKKEHYAYSALNARRGTSCP